MIGDAFLILLSTHPVNGEASVREKEDVQTHCMPDPRGLGGFERMRSPSGQCRPAGRSPMSGLGRSGPLA